MSKFFNDTLNGLLEAVEIEKNKQQLKGKFVKIDVKSEIEKRRENEPEFRKAWDELKSEK